MNNPIYTKAVADAAADAARYPTLSGGKAYVSVTDTAKLVRAALAKNFPGVKFYVRSDTYAGGASIRVYYDGRDRYGTAGMWFRADYDGKPLDDPVPFDVFDKSDDRWSGRWLPVMKAGMPRSKDVDAALAGFVGGGFDGMIDLAYYVASWLLPDGTAALAHSDPTTGSHYGYDFPAPAAGAVRVHFGADHVFVNDSLPYGMKGA